MAGNPVWTRRCLVLSRISKTLATNGFEKHPKTQVFAQDIVEATTFNNAYSLNDRTRTFLKVQDGCDYSCTFCTIPLARGKSRSDTIENVLNSAREIAQNEVKEIVLTGVNTGDFGIRNGKREDKFIDLITALDQVEGIDRIRISSIEPNLLTEEIIQFTASAHKFMPHFHIPLQSGSNKVLKSMKRRYKRELYTERVEFIHQAIPDCCIGVDVIVGYPGESDADFMETYNYLNELNVAYLHVFTYSERANTLANEMDDIVPQKERAKRSKMLRSLSEKKRRFFYNKFAGTSRKVLFEKDVEGGKIHGYSDNYLRVAVKYSPELINQLCDISLLEVNATGMMIGELAASEVSAV
ncbi:UNVERIFIED_CONTAM: hypothetical protein GTU68_001424 [Idotea baltica]|nr:hypothetical protein [Idotea baltica]